MSGCFLFIRFSRYEAWACFGGGPRIGTKKVGKIPIGTCFIFVVRRPVCVLVAFQFVLVCVLVSSHRKRKNLLFRFVFRWQLENGAMHKPHTMRRLSSTHGKGGITGPPKGGDRNWNPAGPSGSQAWPQGNKERSDGQYRRVTDTDVVPPPGFTPKHRPSSAHRKDYGNFHVGGERDADRRRSRDGTRRHRSKGRTQHHGRKTSDCRSREGHRTRSRRNKDRKKRRRTKKDRRSSRSDSRSSFTSVTKQSTHSEKLAAAEPQVKHPDIMGMDRAAFEQRLKECPDFVRVVHDFIQHEQVTRAANRGEPLCRDEGCIHLLPWAVPWTVPEEEIRTRNWYSRDGQNAAFEMFGAMQKYMNFFKPAPGASLQAQVPAGTGTGGGGGGCLVCARFRVLPPFFYIRIFCVVLCGVSSRSSNGK